MNSATDKLLRFKAVLVSALGFAASWAGLNLSNTAAASTVDWPAASEWSPLMLAPGVIGDPENDENQEHLEIVGQHPTEPAAYVHRDATHLYFRLRINATALNAQDEFKPFGWGCLLDTDGNSDNYEFMAHLDGIREVVEWSRNTVQGTVGDPSDKAERALYRDVAGTHARQVSAGTVFPVDAPDEDFFVDFAVELGGGGNPGALEPNLSLPTEPADIIDLDAPMSFICGTSASAQTLDKDLSGVGATIDSLLSDPLTCDASGCETCNTNAACGATCLPCGDTSPICNTTTLACEPCTADPQCPGTCDDISGACDGCLSDDDCSGSVPFCGAANVCVACLGNEDCPALTPECSVEGMCSCIASGAEICGNGVDEDCDSNLDNGCVSIDTDGDGLSDDTETALGTDPEDADSDDDGVSDGEEVDGANDSDGDGLINALDPDSDNDGLFDGTELGLDCSSPSTNLGGNHCRADLDPTTTTSPIDPDTDGGGVSDGSEDANLDGRVDAGETDPTFGNGADDATLADTDGDGLTDILETALGSDPVDADSDDDGLPDGEEPNPSGDADGDDIPNILDPDSDGDGLFDGTEVGFDCTSPAINLAAMNCVPDADQGATTTNPLLADTDNGGVSDGAEDDNQDGAIDDGETDPNDPSDDADPSCSADGGVCETPDAGVTAPDDASVPEIDAGMTSPGDAAAPEIDAGTEPEPSMDAGTEPEPSIDAGTEPEPSMPGMDAGTEPEPTKPGMDPEPTTPKPGSGGEGNEPAGSGAVLEGGGLRCAVNGSELGSANTSGSSALWLLLGLLGATRLRRRRG